MESQLLANAHVDLRWGGFRDDFDIFISRSATESCLHACRPLFVLVKIAATIYNFLPFDSVNQVAPLTVNSRGRDPHKLGKPAAKADGYPGNQRVSSTPPCSLRFSSN